MGKCESKLADILVHLVMLVRERTERSRDTRILGFFLCSPTGFLQGAALLHPCVSSGLSFFIRQRRLLRPLLLIRIKARLGRLQRPTKRRHSSLFPLANPTLLFLRTLLTALAGTRLPFRTGVTDPRLLSRSLLLTTFLPTFRERRRVPHRILTPRTIRNDPRNPQPLRDQVAKAVLVH
jgi:hypothetical protein